MDNSNINTDTTIPVTCDLSHVPQLHETTEQRNARMRCFAIRSSACSCIGPCTIGDREIGWGRQANRPWDVNGVQTPRTSDPHYDAYYQRFNPTKFDPDAWVKTAKAAGMKYMVLVTKHHDGFCQFDTKLTNYGIMAVPYAKDIVRQFVEACHNNGMKVGLYYSTRDWHHEDYLVGDNVKYDEYYRGQINELLSN
jgi:alpha-L-fucosidase